MEDKVINLTIMAGNIHRLRLAANLTQSELANNINVSKSSVSTWEKGIKKPSLINILVLCNYFNVTVDDLIGVSTVIKKR